MEEVQARVSDGDDAKSPIEHLLDACVYAPIGFALEARSLLPRFVDRGRNQIVLARVVGKYAVRKGTRATEGRFNQAQEQMLGVLRLVHSAEPQTDHHAAVEPDAESNPPTGPNGSTVSGNGKHAAAPTATRNTSDVDAATLAIPDYDSLSASQVVPRLESLTVDELELVRRYEAETRGRKTILNKIAQLQSH
jgi:hypothetical protein